MRSVFGQAGRWCALGAALVALVAAGCGDEEEPGPTTPTPQCLNDTTCGEGLLCRGGVCRGCLSDDECGDGRVCDERLCRDDDPDPDPEPDGGDADTDLDINPDADADDADGGDPDAEVGDDVGPDAPPLTCAEGCPGLQRCDEATLTCVEPAICVQDEDCAAGRACVAGSCRGQDDIIAQGGCTEDAHCGAEGTGLYCNLLDHRCAPGGPCTNDGQCPQGLHCNPDGICVPCAGAGHCPGALVCDTGMNSLTRWVCVEPGTCTSDDGCHGDRVCSVGVCGEPICTGDTFDAAGNQSCDDAAAVEPGTTYMLRACGAACDWFRVDLDAGDGLLARVLHEVEDGDLDLTLRSGPCGAGGGPVLDRSATLDPAEVVTLPVARTSGTYWLAVCPFVEPFDQGTNAYVLDLQVVEGGFCIDDTLDRASGGNDTPVDASPLGTPARPLHVQTADLQVCPERPDWYRIAVNAGELVVLTLDFEDSSGNLGLAVFDDLPAEDELPRWQSDGRTNREQVAFLAPEQGDLYAFVKPAATQTAYALDLQIFGDECGDLLEPAGSGNNSRAAASALDAPTTLDGLRLCEGDTDWYSVTVAPGEAAAIQLTWDPDLPADLTVTAFRASGDPAPVQVQGRNGTASVIAAPTSGDQIIFRVESSGATNLPYRLHVERQSAMNACLDDGRDNDTLSTSTPSPLGVQEIVGQLCPGATPDADYLRFDVPPASRVFADLTPLDGPAAALQLELLGRVGETLIAGMPAGGGISAQIDVPSGGEIHARVRGANAMTHAAWLLQVYTQPSAPNGTCGEDALEPGTADPAQPNNTFDNGRTIPAGQWARNLIACPGDTDWYRVNTPAGVDLRLRVETHSAAPGLLEARLWGVGGAPSAPLSDVASTTDGGTLELLVPWYMIFDGGLQGVEIRSTGGATVWYDLRVDTVE